MTKEITIPGIVETLHSPEPEVRKLAIAALTQIGPKASRNAAQELVAALGNSEESVRDGAEKLLIHIGESAAPVLITAVFHSQRPGIRCASIRILEKIRPMRAKVRDCLEAALRDPDKTVVASARNALVTMSSGTIKAEAAPRLRKGRRRALSTIGPNSQH